MKRLTMDDLEAIAHSKGKQIEVDDAASVAVVTVGRVVYYAPLPETEVAR